MAPRGCSLCGSLCHDKTIKFCVSCGATLPPVGLLPQNVRSINDGQRGTSINESTPERKWSTPQSSEQQPASKCLYFMSFLFLTLATGAFVISGLDLQVRWDTGNFGPHDDHYDVTFDAGVLFIGARFKHMGLSPNGLPPVCTSGEAPPCHVGQNDDDLLLQNQILQPCITMWGQKSTLVDLVKENTKDHNTIQEYVGKVQSQCLPIKLRAGCLVAAVVFAAFAAYINLAMLCCGCCGAKCATITSLMFSSIALAGAGGAGYFTYQQKKDNPRPLVDFQETIYNGTRHVLDDDDAIQHLSYGWGFYELAGGVGMLLLAIFFINANICCFLYSCCRSCRGNRGAALLERP